LIPRAASHNRLSTLSQTSGNATGCSSVFSLSWTYDAWGNRTDQNVTAGTCNSFHATVGTNNRLASPYAYDAAGNMTSDGTHTYTYDAENRLIAVGGGTTASYSYDPSGRRAAKTTGGTTTSYVYDQAGNVVFNTQGSSWVTTYLYFAGGLLAQYKIGLTLFIHGDRLGSTHLVTFMNQSHSDNLDYLPFGEQLTGDTSTTHKFTGQERDAESNLDYFGARQYSSQNGRFMTADPLGMGAADLTNPQSLNQYAYVGNNPTNVTDPSGMDWGDGGDFGGFGGFGGCDWCEGGGTGWGVPSIPGWSGTGLPGGSQGPDPASLAINDNWGYPGSGNSSDSAGSGSGASPNNGTQPDKNSCAARLAKGIQKYTGTSPFVDPTAAFSQGGHDNYNFTVPNPASFQGALNQNPPWPLPLGLDRGHRYGLINSTHILDPVAAGDPYTGHTDLFNGHSVLAPLHLLIDVGIGHIPGVNLDLGCHQ
jgi:RHS repeat-associated protein